MAAIPVPKLPYPKLVALDTDGTIFTGQLDQNVWGKGPNASQELSDNIERRTGSTSYLQDKSNHRNCIHLSNDIPRIVTDVLDNGAQLAIVSRNTSKELCDRALFYFEATHPTTQKEEPIIKMVNYDEVVDEPKTKHFGRIKGWSKFDYTDMIFFDDEPEDDVARLGVTVRQCNPNDGLTWDIYSKTLQDWRHAKNPLQQPPGSTTLNIAHFNDVYQISEQKIRKTPGSGAEESIDVTKFATLLNNVTAKWNDRDGGGKDGLILFSGDLFSPSVESSFTSGMHMPAIMQSLKVDVAVAGNHEFDFGYPQLQKLIPPTGFPWLFSNIIDRNTGKVPEPLKEVHVLVRAGIRIGFIGLVEKEWLNTVTDWPAHFEFEDMAKVGKLLSDKLRDPAGDYKCDLIIALTHSGIRNDIRLAKALFALSPAAQASKNIASEHGVDLLLGGHDHIYWISKGVTEWDGYDLGTPQGDATEDEGDVLVVKSGTDFQELSEVIITLTDTPAGSIRKKTIQSIKGKRHITRGGTEVNEELKKIVDQELEPFEATMNEPICYTEVPLNVDTGYIRKEESPIGNWVADCLRQSYDDILVKGGHGKVDGVILCTGDFRGNGYYSPGLITARILRTILTYDDPTIVVKLDAKTLLATLEHALSEPVSLKGRFPAISGLRVSWDSSKEAAGQRLREVWLQAESDEIGVNGRPKVVDKEKVDALSTRKYLIMIGNYMLSGGDGYDVLKGAQTVINPETGKPKVALIKQFLNGAQYINKAIREGPKAQKALQPKTLEILVQVQSQVLLDRNASFTCPRCGKSCDCSRDENTEVNTSNAPRPVVPAAQGIPVDPVADVKWTTSEVLFSAALRIPQLEDMGLLNSYERQKARMMLNLRQRAQLESTNIRMNFSILDFLSPDMDEAKIDLAEKVAMRSLPIIHPVVDGRLKDVAPKPVAA